MTDGLMRKRQEDRIPANAESNCIFVILNNTTAVTAVDIVLTMVPAIPLWNRNSLVTNGKSNK